MSDQAELSCLIVENLTDFEAAAHQIDEVIIPLLEEAVERIVTDVIEKRGWGGEFGGIDAFWVAPTAWADDDGDEDDYVCHFEIDTVPRSERDSDYFSLSSLTGAGFTKMGLFWTSEAIRPPQLGRLVAEHADVIAQLQAKGFVYDIGDRHALYLPIQIDRALLVSGLRAASLDDAVEGFATALDVAIATVSIFQPLFEQLNGGAEAER